MEQTLPKPIDNKVEKLINAEWTTKQADAAADFIRELRYEATKLGQLTAEEAEWKTRIDAKLAAEANALAVAGKAESKIKPTFIAFAQREVAVRNSQLAVSKQTKNLSGKGWTVQLKDKAGTVSVVDNAKAVNWLKKFEPAALKTVVTVIAAQLTQNPKLKKKIDGLKADELAEKGILVTPVIADGASTVKVEDFDKQA